MSDGRKALAEQEEADRIAAGGKSDFELREERYQRRIQLWKDRFTNKVDKMIQDGLSEREALLTLLAEHVVDRH